MAKSEDQKSAPPATAADPQKAPDPEGYFEILDKQFSAPETSCLVADTLIDVFDPGKARVLIEIACELGQDGFERILAARVILAFAKKMHGLEPIRDLFGTEELSENIISRLVDDLIKVPSPR